MHHLKTFLYSATYGSDYLAAMVLKYGMHYAIKSP